MSDAPGPDFYDFKTEQEQGDLDEEWLARPPRKGKKKKKARRHEEDLFPTEGGQNIEAGPAIAEDDVPITAFEGVDLREDDFPPDRLALDVATSPESPTVLEQEEDGHVEDVVAAMQNAREPSRPILPTPLRPAADPVSSVSPPQSRQAASYASPKSFLNPSGNQKTKARPNLVSTRKESFPAYASSPHHFVEPTAPPHMPQAHYFGLPDFGLGFGSKKQQSDGQPAGSNGYCCCFDSFADSGDSVSGKKAQDALLVGSEGGLEAYRVLPNKVEVVGRLEGLRGSVIAAKILPHVALYDDVQHLRPLVAVIIHGLMSGESSSQRYQTTVEVYSSQTQQHVATLFRTVPVAVEQPTLGHLTTLPEPTEHLSLAAHGKFITLASGKSGEVFIFSRAARADEELQYRCIGKFWTSLQSSIDDVPSRPSSSSGTSPNAAQESERPRMPLLSLSSRWLALVPPSTASHVSIRGSPLSDEHNLSPPGLASAVAPPQPPITCELSGIGTEDAWSRFTRQATQGVVKASQKGIELGWQGWKELTNPTPLAAQHVRGSSKDRDDIFPPTNAPRDNAGKPDKEPAVVSIIDLEALLDAEEARAKYPPPSLATFGLPDGCNFLGFSSDGLRLLTVSRKGEMSSVWSLSRCCYDRTNSSDGNVDTKFATGPIVELIHRIPRTSQSVVVDCVWMRDDEHLALLTTHGTAHLHEIPTDASSRKRKRRKDGAGHVPEKAQATVSVSQASSPPSSNAGFLGSLRSGLQQVTTQVSGARSKSSTSGYGIPTSFAGFREATTSASQAGGRVLVKGLSQGLSAAKGGASDYWHADDNKIRHKELQDAKGGSIRWIKRQSDLYIAVVCGGTVYLHPVHRTQKWKGDVLVTGLRHEKHGKKNFALPSIRIRDDSVGTQPAISSGDHPHGFWSLRHTPGAAVGSDHRTDPPHMNEIETNPPYCPFHIDSRVDVFTFDTKSEDRTYADSADQAPGFLSLGQGSKREPPWLFGRPLPASTKMSTHDKLDFVHRGFDLDSDDDIDLRGQVESVLTVRTAADDGKEEIHVSTHRTRNEAEDEDMEFDDFEYDED